MPYCLCSYKIKYVPQVTGVRGTEWITGWIYMINETMKEKARARVKLWTEYEVEESEGERGWMMLGESSGENEIRVRNKSDESEGQKLKTEWLI